eukprot:COSAG06_NODE_85126_length_100_cov_123.000000_1_plen_22_part_01
MAPKEALSAPALKICDRCITLH